MKKPSSYRTTKEIVIPAGTLLNTAPVRTDRSDKDGNPAISTGKPAHFVEATIGLGRDATSTWTMHIGDAIDCGMIEPSNG